MADNERNIITINIITTVVYALKLPYCSVAILKYLCETFDLPDHWYPKDLKKRARVDQYLAWQHLNVRKSGGTYFMIQVL